MEKPGAPFLAVIDFEATCDKGQASIAREEMEIIEFGAALVRSDDFRILSEFQRFVRPVRHPQLTAFCTGLTSISQEQVDAAEGFPDVLHSFRQWLLEFPGALFCSWGEYDRRQLLQDCRYHAADYPFPNAHFNLKTAFAKSRGISGRIGLGQALDTVGLKFIGTPHRGIDDVRNILRLLPYMFRDQAL